MKDQTAEASVDGRTSRRRVLFGAAIAAAGAQGLLGGAGTALAAGPAKYDAVAYGAVGDGSTDDTTAIQNAIDAAATSVDGGIVTFPPGTYIVTGLAIRSWVVLQGSGVGISILKMKDNTNQDVVKTLGFATPVTQAYFALFDLTIDGNKTYNTSGGAGLRLYGKSFRIENVVVKNCRSHGIYSSWSSGGDDMEAHVRSVKVHDCEGNGIEWRGPHDSTLSDFQVFRNGTYGVLCDGESWGSQFVNGHVWGDHDTSWCLRTSVLLANCVGEGATSEQLLVEASDIHAVGCYFFGDGTSFSDVGVRVGTSTKFVSRTWLDCRVTGCVDKALIVDGANEAYSYIRASIEVPSGGTGLSGTPHSTSVLIVQEDKNSPAAANNFIQLAGKIGFYGTTPVVQSTGWSVTSVPSRKALTNTSSASDVREVLGTLVSQLKTMGLLG